MSINPCLVCGEEVSSTAILSEYKGKKYYFSSTNCKKEFDENPEKYFVAQKTG